MRPTVREGQDQTGFAGVLFPLGEVASRMGLQTSNHEGKKTVRGAGRASSDVWEKVHKQEVEA